MSSLYRNEASYPKNNAQRNLSGRTHYVDDDTLRWHKSRVISARHTDGGLLFAIVTSDALDMNNSRRGFRFVIFDLFGTVQERTEMEQAFRTSARAEKAMWAELNAMDAPAITRAAIANAEKHHAMEMERMRAEVAKLVANNETGAA
jgi:hypothetical protein